MPEARTKTAWVDVRLIASTKIPDAAFIAYVVICGAADDKGVCRASDAELGKLAGGRHKRAVRRGISCLLRAGIVHKPSPTPRSGRRLIVSPRHFYRPKTA